jgi:hypothetical protein
MKNFFLITLFTSCLVGSSFVYSQGGYFGMRCAVWSDTSLDKSNKIMFYNGLGDGLMFADLSMQGIKIPNMSQESAMSAIDLLCSDFANMSIPVAFIFKVVAMRVAGEDDDVVKAEVLRLRQAFAEL